MIDVDLLGIPIPFGTANSIVQSQNFKKVFG